MLKMMSFMSILLAGVMLLSGCVMTVQAPGSEQPISPNPIVEEPKVEEPKVEIVSDNSGFNEFDSTLIKFIDDKKGQENYMISPMSFKYALGLAVLGSDGETKEELLKAMGYTSFDDLAALDKRMKATLDNFNMVNESNKRHAYGDEKIDEITFEIANSVWDLYGLIKEDYKKEVKEKLNAEAKSVEFKNAVSEINAWVEEKTRGLIPNALNNLNPDIKGVLVNTLYLKSNWLEQFDLSSKPLKFTDIDGNKVDKESMYRQDKYKYYKDKDVELVIVPLSGGIEVVYVVGDKSNIEEKINKAEYKEVLLEVPMMEFETSLEKGELVDYLSVMGVEKAFRGDADFDKMADDFFISDILQKTKIKTDEEGLEAAAVTIITMKANAFIEPEKPIEFTIDEPFSFYIYSEQEGIKDLMFYGQYVK